MPRFHPVGLAAPSAAERGQDLAADGACHLSNHAATTCRRVEFLGERHWLEWGARETYLSRDRALDDERQEFSPQSNYGAVRTTSTRCGFISSDFRTAESSSIIFCIRWS